MSDDPASSLPRTDVHRPTCWLTFAGRLLGGLLAIGHAPEVALGAEPASPAVDLRSYMDLKIQPGDDFFAYANGTWLKTAVIPADRSSWGAEDELIELTDKRVAELLQQAAHAAPPNGSVARQAADYYTSYLDEAAIDARGLAPLRPALQRIQAIQDPVALARMLGSMLRADIDIINNTQVHTDNLFGLWVAQDLDDPAHYAPFLVQGGLGMPDREDYLSDDGHARALQAAYRHYIATQLRLIGVASEVAAAQAARIYDLERRIAKVHVSRSESEDVQRGHNHWRRQDFAQRAPGLDWETFFASAELGDQAQFVVWQPSAVTGVAALVAGAPLSTWREYLSFHTIDHFAEFLPHAFVNAHFAFHGKALVGTPQLPARWKRAVRATNAALGDAVGQLYVARYFPPQAKERIDQLVHNLIGAFAAHIDTLEWMAPVTRIEAKAKLASLKVGVGYPEHWRDYSGLEVVAADAFGNAERAEQFDYRYNIAKLTRPQVDRSEWVTAPQVVNAFNLPAMNAVIFPAAILQPPNFDADGPAALNYGNTGSTIGHEISHSFDDQGAQFDASGRLRNWWTPQDYARFKDASAQLVRQFDAYRPFADLAVNGAQTLSENIADLAGVALAYRAFRASLGGAEAPPLDGFSSDQQFFIGFAQSWRTQYRDPALRQSIIEDGHAPDRYRADSVRNLDAWYEAFGVQPGEMLYLPPAERIQMW